MFEGRRASTTWTSRRGLAWVLRASTVAVPLVVAVVAMIAVGRTLPRPSGGLVLAGWYLLLLAVSYAASWVASKLMNRALPLAALLEMSLQFPERAPSRLGMTQRRGSSEELARLATVRPDESAQEAAERILRLLTALSAHDKFTRGHAERVRAYTDLIAEKMGVSEHDRERLRWAALLHDIGKLRVPSALLNKPAKPTAAEWELLRQHPSLGSVIAGPLLPWLQPMERVIAEHHERFDGTGYPVGLSGEAISPGARIVTVADCFEAMTAARAYNRPMRREAALAEIVACAGTQFDPVVVRALLAVPHRRLLWAMGPTAWLAGLPLVGQGSLGALRTAVGHAGGAAVSATVVAVAAVAPTSLIGTPTPQPQPTHLAAATAPAASATAAPPGSTSAATSAEAPVRPAARVSATHRPSPRPTGTPPARPAHPRVPGSTAPARGSTTTPRPTSHAGPTSPWAPTTTPPAPTTPAEIPTTTKAAPTTTPPQAVPTTTTARPTTHAAPPPTTTRPPTTTAPPTTNAPTTAPPTTAPPTTTAPAHGRACVATYTAANAGSGDLNGSISVKNTGTLTMTGWTVTWSWPAGQQLQTFSGALVVQVGTLVTAKSPLLAAAVKPGRSASFTLTASGKAPVPFPVLTCTPV